MHQIVWDGLTHVLFISNLLDCYNNIYISTPNTEVHNIVEDALKEAIVNHNSLRIYNIKVDFLTDDISFVLMCRKNIKVKSFYSKEKGQNITSISFSLRAFGQCH